jgi:hypothetical protein
MRKLFTLAILVVSFVSLHAQIKKGSIFLGGNLSGSTQKTKSADTAYTSQNGFYVSPVFGKAIKDNLVFGANFDIGLFEDKSSGNANEQKQRFYGVGFFLRKYKELGSSDFYLFVQGNLNGDYSRYKQSATPSWINDTKRYTVSVNAYPGISYAINKKFHLETGFNNLLSLSYWRETRLSGFPAVSYKTNGVSIGASLNNLSNLYLGFRLLIGK